ncbi:retrotransposon gag protein, partial [Rhizoctonia solani AG-3 Rhs1AP]
MSAPTTFLSADPTSITIPTDDSGIITAFNEIKAILVAMNHNLGLAIDQIKAHHADIATADANHKALEGSVSNVETVLMKVQAELSKISSGGAGPSTLGGSKKGLKISEPTKFDGSDKTKATAFRTALTHYIRVNGPGSTADEQIAFIISYLDGAARDWLDPFQEQDEVLGNTIGWLHDVNLFWDQFNSRWNVQNRTENFRTKFMALRQNTGSVQDYWKDFQTYSQGLGYNDAALRDTFYSGLNVKAKETLMLQNYTHTSGSLQDLAAKALENDERLREFQKANKSALGGASSSGTKGSSTSTAAQGAPRDKLTVGEKVYQLGSDGKAKKGTIVKIGKNKKGLSVPTVKWNDGTEEVTQFKGLKKDEHPVPNPTPRPPKSGPTPMDLDGAGSSKKGKSVVCSNCGGKGHYANQCPSRSLSGQAAHLSDFEESEKEDL